MRASLKFLSNLCNRARTRGKMVAANPCTGIMQQLKANDIKFRKEWKAARDAAKLALKTG